MTVKEVQFKDMLPPVFLKISSIFSIVVSCLMFAKRVVKNFFKHFPRRFFCPLEKLI